jgi:hypothetical protein
MASPFGKHGDLKDFSLKLETHASHRDFVCALEGQTGNLLVRRRHISLCFKSFLECFVINSVAAGTRNVTLLAPGVRRF